MGFYDLPKAEREKCCQDIQNDILRGLRQGDFTVSTAYFNDSDTYIRKAAYLGAGKIFKQKQIDTNTIIAMLDMLIKSDSERIRQTVINAAGEIAMLDFACVEHLFDIARIIR